ncbi:hypothetical protein BSQ39_07145 [Loigolactobacillus backii]|uniref:LysR family transcriptional regulator n=1 Tax=Loigolactobacillus backii TaxID=375175 RepID=UPI000C1C9B9B|nr:LysR family transcriptional regulator [Loigolactobacillus backii]PIO83344.1 hypothetical protein BSQ39_07145 [Loigolactobacillus backii]
MKTFLLVSQLGSFEKAANVELRSQRAVSKKMTSLENELGIQLFDRRTNRIKLTVAGQYFVGTVQDLLQSYQSAVQQLQDVQQHNAVLRIGYFSIFEAALLHRSLKKLQEKRPATQFVLQELSNEHLTESIVNGNLDLALSINYGIDPLADTPKLGSFDLYQNQMVLGVSPLNPLANKKVVEQADLQGKDILYYSPEGSTFLLESFLFNNPSIQNYEHVRRVSSFEQMQLLVALNQAIAFYPQGLLNSSLLANLQDTRDIIFKPIASPTSKQAYRIIAFYSPSNQNPVLKDYLRLNKNELGANTAEKQ